MTKDVLEKLQIAVATGEGIPAAARAAHQLIERLEAALRNAQIDLISMGFEDPKGYVSKLFRDTPQRVLANITNALREEEA